MSYSANVYPYDCVCYVSATIGGTVWQASGVIVGPHTVLTASHELWHLGQGATNVQVYPAYSDGGSAIQGKESWHYYQIPETVGFNGQALLTQSASQQDFAIIDFAADLSPYGWFGYETNFGGGTVHVTGYPATAGGLQTDAIGTVTADSSYTVLDYGSLATQEGNSGGPLWVNLGTAAAPDPRVVGVVSTGGWATQLTTADWNVIQGWEQSDSSLWTTQTPAPSPTPSSPAPSALMLVDTTTGQTIPAATTAYSGPVAGLQYQYVYTGKDNLNITVTSDNWFLKGGPGTDALQAHGGYNVLDGGTDSNFLTGGSGGTNTFFVDDRGPPSDVWSTVNNFHQGDDATVFGVVPNGSNTFQWVDGQGAVGFTGLTLHVFTPRQPTASLTLPGYSSSDLGNGRLSLQFGNEADGTPYLHIIGTG